MSENTFRRSPLAVWAAVAAGMLLLAGVLAMSRVGAVASPYRGVAVIQRASPFFLQSVSNRLENVASEHGGRLPPGRVVLTGSSTIERWTSSADDLVEWPTVNVGIGGSTLMQHASATGELIRPLRPGALVVYVGVNDLVVPRRPKPFDPTAGQGAALVRTAKAYFAGLSLDAPEAHIYYIGMIESPRKRPVLNDLRLFNTRVRELAERSDRITYIDVNHALAGEDGLPSPDYFVDGLHLNADGYRILARQVRDALRAGPNP